MSETLRYVGRTQEESVALAGQDQSRMIAAGFVRGSQTWDGVQLLVTYEPSSGSVTPQPLPPPPARPPATVQSGTAPTAATVPLWGLLMLAGSAAAIISPFLTWFSAEDLGFGGRSATGMELFQTSDTTPGRYYPIIVLIAGCIGVAAASLFLARPRPSPAAVVTVAGVVAAIPLALLFMDLRPMLDFLRVNPLELLGVGYWVGAAGAAVSLLAGAIALVSLPRT